MGRLQSVCTNPIRCRKAQNDPDYEPSQGSQDKLGERPLGFHFIRFTVLYIALTLFARFDLQKAAHPDLEPSQGLKIAKLGERLLRFHFIRYIVLYVELSMCTIVIMNRLNF
jgi:hypothetical protein